MSLYRISAEKSSMFVPMFGREKQCVCNEVWQRKAVCLYRISAEKRSVFVPNFGREKQYVYTDF